MKETDQRAVVVAEEKKTNLVLIPLVGVYLLSSLITLSHLGEPFPFMGKLHVGDSSESLVFADTIVSLYLMIGIVKRQRLTLWLLVAYNALASLNGMANLLLLPVQKVMTASGVLVPDYQYRLELFSVFVLFLMLNVFLYVNRRHFDNTSIYLW